MCVGVNVPQNPIQHIHQLHTPVGLTIPTKRTPHYGEMRSPPPTKVGPHCPVRNITMSSSGLRAGMGMRHGRILTETRMIGMCPPTIAADHPNQTLTPPTTTRINTKETSKDVAVTSVVNQITARTDAAMANPLRVKHVGKRVINLSIIISTRETAKKGVPLVLTMMHIQGMF